MTKKRTYDFILREREHMLIFLNAMKTRLHKVHSERCDDTLPLPSLTISLYAYKMSMFKMKVAYAAFMRNELLSRHILSTMERIIEERFKVEATSSSSKALQHRKSMFTV